MANKDLSYYRQLPYTRRVRIEEDPEGQYFVAFVVELDGLEADGETAIEALFHLQEAFDEYIVSMIGWGEVIPQPEHWTERVPDAIPFAVVERTRDEKVETETAEQHDRWDDGAEWDVEDKQVATR